MMEDSSTLVLGIRVPQNSFRKVTLSVVDLHGKVGNLRVEAAQETGLEREQILLVYGGVPLDDSNTIMSYGIKSGYTIHVLKKKQQVDPTSPKVKTDKQIKDLEDTYRRITESLRFRMALVRLTRPNPMEEYFMSIPELRQNHLAVAIVRDPELLMYIMYDKEAVRKLALKHPVLMEALSTSLKEGLILDRQTNRAETTASGGASTSAGFFSDAFSGGEDMDSSQSSDSPPARSSSSSVTGENSASFSGMGITSNQLEAALAAIGASNPPGAPGSSNATGSQSQDRGNFITPEMFNNALMQAIQGIPYLAAPSTPTSANGSRPFGGAGPSGGSTPGSSANPPQYLHQLQQMRELGLRDHLFNLQALQITNGDVEAAIELVMSSGNGNGRDDDDEGGFSQG